MKALEIVEQDGMDVSFVVPWKGKEIPVKWEAPAGCIMGAFRFDLKDEDEAEEFEQFLRDKVRITTNVFMEDNDGR